MIGGYWVPLLSVAALGLWLAGRTALAIAWTASELTRPTLRRGPAARRRPSQRPAWTGSANPAEQDAAVPRQPPTPTLPLGPPPTAESALSLSSMGIAALARDSARGEHLDVALRRLDETLQALEVDGCVVLYETRIGDALIRRAVIAETGVFVVAAQPPLWGEQGDELHRQAAALALRLAIQHTDIEVVLALEGEREPAYRWHCGTRFMPVSVLGRAQLRVWILSRPRRIERAALDGLRDEIEAAKPTAARATRPNALHLG